VSATDPGVADRTVVAGTVTPWSVSKVTGLRANAFAAVVMLIVEFGLGIGVNLYSTLPRADHGKGVFPAFGRAVTGGPVVLSLHALLGTLLLVAGVSVVVRAALIRRGPLTAVAGVALLAILVAWVSGTRFVGQMGNGVSLGMALATGVALLCYVMILFVVPSPGRPPNSPGREAAD
jgi:hypothetical protein